MSKKDMFKIETLVSFEEFGQDLMSMVLGGTSNVSPPVCNGFYVCKSKDGCLNNEFCKSFGSCSDYMTCGSYAPECDLKAPPPSHN